MLSYLIYSAAGFKLKDVEVKLLHNEQQAFAAENLRNAQEAEKKARGTRKVEALLKKMQKAAAKQDEFMKQHDLQIQREALASIDRDHFGRNDDAQILKSMTGDDPYCMGEQVKIHSRKAGIDAPSRSLRYGRPFTFLRIGDGDINCITGQGGTGSNNDGIEYARYPDQCHELARDLSEFGSTDDSNLFVLVGTLFLCKNPELQAIFDSFLQETKLHPSFKGFITSGFYMDLIGDEYRNLPRAIPGAQETFPYLVGRKVVAVGPTHLKKLQRTLNLADFIDAHDAAGRIDDLVYQMGNYSAQWPKENVVFLVSAGFGGRLAMYRSWKVLGHKDTFIDTGASLDGFAGVESRDSNDKEKMCMNLPEFMASGVCRTAAVTVV